MDGNMNWAFPVDTYNLWATSELEGIPDVEVPHNMARAVVRTDTHKVLGVHGSKYKIIRHDDVVNSIADSVKQASISQDYDMSVEVFEDGRKLRGEIIFHDHVIEPSVGDYIKFRIQFFNSYDGSWAFQQSTDGLRLWCLNGCTTADSVAKTWAKHTANINISASADKVINGLDMFMNNRDLYQEYMQTPVDHRYVEAVAKNLSLLPKPSKRSKYNEKQLECIVASYYNEEKNLGQNKWALYNGLTYWASHTQDTSSPANTRRQRENQLAKLFKNNTVWHNTY